MIAFIIMSKNLVNQHINNFAFVNIFVLLLSISEHNAVEYKYRALLIHVIVNWQLW